jgi:WD40 repeat protein
MIRSLSFTEDSTKLLSSSDDYSIKLIDINSETVTNTF